MQKNALRDLRAQFLIFLRILEEVYDFCQFFLLFDRTRDIRKLDFDLIGRSEPRPVRTEREHAVAVSGLPVEIDEYNDSQNNEPDDRQRIKYGCPVYGFRIIITRYQTVVLIVLKLIDQIGNISVGDAVRDSLLHPRQIPVLNGYRCAVYLDLADAVIRILDDLHNIGKRGLGSCSVTVPEHNGREHEQQYYKDAVKEQRRTESRRPVRRPWRILGRIVFIRVIAHSPASLS